MASTLVPGTGPLGGPWSWRALGSALTAAAFPAALVGSVLVLVVPLPAALLDLLLVANLTLAVLVLLTTIAIDAPRQFSAFPTVLLAAALFRLVLNVASTRLILANSGEEGLDAAGGVIRAFGEFVAGGRDQVIVGAILFLILVIIQFVVITKGATRIGEVAARFMLDGLPGRQMAIDADLAAGQIDQDEAQRRRDELYRQADFFAAMDGAGKFVRGDAIAGLMIAGINIIGGLGLGIFRYGMSPSAAVDVFTKLTIGDGLVSQVPAFLTALAAGLIVTRSTSSTDLPREVTGQLLGRPLVLGLSAGLLALLTLTPLPTLPLLVIAGGLATAAWAAHTRIKAARIAELPAIATPATPAPAPPAPRIEDLLTVEPLSLEIGYRLIPLIDPARGGDLLDRVNAVRSRLARELGLVVPPLKVRDALELGPNEYRLKLRGAEVGQGTSYPGRLLAVPPAHASSTPKGRESRDPLTGASAVWIHAEGREVAELAGCLVREPAEVVADHLAEVAIGHAEDLLSREACEQMLQRARGLAPALVEEVVPHLLRGSEVRRILQNLLRERVSVRDIEAILEALAERAGQGRDPDELTERVREALGRSIVQPLRGPDGTLRVVTLARGLERRIVEQEFTPDGHRGALRAIGGALSALDQVGSPPVVLVSAEARRPLRELSVGAWPRVAILSRREVPRDVAVEVVRTVVEQEAPVVSSVATTGVR